MGTVHLNWQLDVALLFTDRRTLLALFARDHSAQSLMVLPLLSQLSKFGRDDGRTSKLLDDQSFGTS
jgi:hypothetical protein